MRLTCACKRAGVESRWEDEPCVGCQLVCAHFGGVVLTLREEGRLGLEVQSVLKTVEGKMSIDVARAKMMVRWTDERLDTTAELEIFGSTLP